MPLIKVVTSAVVPDRPRVTELLQTLSAQLSDHLGKPEAYVMTCLETEIPMTFGGTDAPACYVEIKSIGNFSAAQTQSMSHAFCQTLGDALGVPPSRIYIEFNNANGTAIGNMWGWNSSIF